MLYFGKTTDPNPVKYKGSRQYWRDHLRVHGNDVDTLWYCLYPEQEELIEFAKMFSELFDIVKSPAWANIKPENGLDGSPNGYTHSEEAKRNMSRAHLGKKMSPTHKANSAKAKSKPCTIDGVLIFPSVVALIAVFGQGKNGLRHPNFKYV